MNHVFCAICLGFFSMVAGVFFSRSKSTGAEMDQHPSF